MQQLFWKNYIVTTYIIHFYCAVQLLFIHNEWYLVDLYKSIFEFRQGKIQAARWFHKSY